MRAWYGYEGLALGTGMAMSLGTGTAMSLGTGTPWSHVMAGHVRVHRAHDTTDGSSPRAMPQWDGLCPFIRVVPG